VPETPDGDNLIVSNVPSSPPPLPPGNFGPIPYYGYASAPIGRPGIITAVLVVSLVVAGLALMGNALTLVISTTLSRIARFNHVPGNHVVAPVSPAVISGEYMAPQGLSSIERRMVLNALLSKQAMPPVQVDRLTALLADQGRRIIPLRGPSLTFATVSVMIAQAYKTPDASGGDDVSEFDLQGGGRLQITNRSAVFFPAEGAAIRVDDSSYTDETGQKRLTPMQINAIVREVEKRIHGKMSAMQQASLGGELAKPSQTLVTPQLSVSQAAGQVSGVQTLGDGSVGITFTGGSVSIGPAGEVVAGIAPASAALNQLPIAKLKISHRVTLVLQLESLLGLALAGLLLAFAILGLRDHPRTRQLYLAYAIAKLALAVLGGVLVYNAWDTWENAFTTSGPFAFIFVITLLGGVFPMVVLILFFIEPLRRYYDAPVAR